MSVDPSGAEAPLRLVPLPAAEVLDLLVVVGTDYHPFDRLVQWVDEWVLQQGAGYRAVVQHGAAAAPTIAGGSALLAHDELQDLMSLARVIVMHGGPASIIEARRLGKVPVVVPRVPGYGEHVDGHQLRFTRRLGELGLVALCETKDDFLAMLTNAGRDPEILQVTGTGGSLGGADNGDGVEAVRHIVDNLLSRRSLHSVIRRCTRWWHARP